MIAAVSGVFRRLLLLALALLLSLLAWWWYRQAPVGVEGTAAPLTTGTASQSAAKGGKKAVHVDGYVVRGEKYTESVSAIGSLLSVQSVTLRPETAGKVAAIHWREGQHVAAGELLVSLDTAIAAAEVAQAQANLRLAEQTQRRNVELLGKKFLSQQAVEDSMARLQVQAALLQLAKARYDKMFIRAPFAGTAGLRYVNIGDYVREGQDLVHVEDISRLFVDFRLPESELARVRLGQTLRLTSDALPAEQFVATVSAIDPLLDKNGRAVSVRATLDNSAGRLRPGLFVRLQLVFAEREQVLFIPEEALVPGTTPYVYRIIDGKVKRTPVRLGQRRAGSVEISEGLKVGDLVVRAGQLKLRDQLPVTVNPMTAAGGEGAVTAEQTTNPSVSSSAGRLE